MELNDILKDLKKVDLNKIEESDVRIFQSEKLAVEYYNDAVDNIIDGNTDIAAIKLKKVLSLSPDFDEASKLLKRINEYENERNLGDKVYDNIRGGGEKAKYPGIEKRTLPQKLNVNPRFLIKLIMVLLAVGIAVVLSILLFRLFDKEKEPEVEDDPAVYYSQDEVDALNSRIEELEQSLAQSEIETQEALAGSNEDRARISELEKENESLSVRLDLYIAASYLNREEYTKSADLVMQRQESDYSGAEKELFNEVYVRATSKAAESVYTVGLNLYNQQEYEGAIENMEKVALYNPEFPDIARCYYIMARSHFELGRADKSIELYEYIALNHPEFENETGLLYYTARAYQETENYDKAVQLYNELINNHPESTLIGYAKDRLREIENR